MRKQSRVSSIRKAVVGAGACALVLGCLAAVAQPPATPAPAPGAAAPARPGGGQMAPNPKAWELESKAVAKDLGLNAEQTTKLVDTYKAARESQTAAMRAKMGE